jgi:hypothetical protein
MKLGCKSYSGLYHENTVGTVRVASKTTGQKEGNEYCSLERLSFQKLLKGSCEASTCNPMGKTKVSREETVKCTSKAAGIEVLAYSERLLEITTGKSHFQPG